MVIAKSFNTYKFSKGLKKGVKLGTLAYLLMKGILFIPGIETVSPDVVFVVALSVSDFIRNFLKMNVPKFFSWL